MENIYSFLKVLIYIYLVTWRVVYSIGSIKSQYVSGYLEISYFQTLPAYIIKVCVASEVIIYYYVIV